MADTEEIQTTQDIVFEIVTRIRDVEGKYNLLRDRALIINQNMIDQYQKTYTDIKIINEDIKVLKEDIFHIKETLKHVISELDHFSRKEDIKVLEKYINLWNPMKFITEEEVRKIIKEEKDKKIDKRGKEIGE
jgi:hypothetical protein